MSVAWPISAVLLTIVVALILRCRSLYDRAQSSETALRAIRANTAEAEERAAARREEACNLRYAIEVRKLREESLTLAFKLKLWKGLAKGYKKRLLPLLGNSPKGESGPVTPEQAARQTVVEEVVAEVAALVPASEPSERRRLIAWALGEVDAGRDSDDVLIELRRGDTSLTPADTDDGE